MAEAVQAALDAIEEKDQTINAFITVDREGALKAAEEIQKKIDAGVTDRASGRRSGGGKDNICTKGLKTTCASKILYNFVPTYNAEVIDNLRRAGMVVVGKPNMDEFAMGSTTETSYFGVTRNPRNPEHVPGGSSGGSCAAVGGRGSSLRPGQRHRRLHPSAQLFLRGYRAEAYLRGCLPYGLIAYGSSLDQIGPVARDEGTARRCFLSLLPMTGRILPPWSWRIMILWGRSRTMYPA